VRIRFVVVVVVVAFALLASAVDVVRISGESMAPKLRSNQVVLVNRLAYGLQPPLIDTYLVRWGQPRQGEVVFFHNPVDGALTVKRAIAVAGDSIAVTQGGTHVGATTVDLSGFAHKQLAGRSSIAPRSVFVLGDNRLASRDSRHYGPIHMLDVFGTLLRLQGQD